MRSCVTISLVEEARGGPFVFWDGLEHGIRTAKELGFDAVELFIPSPDAVDLDELNSLLKKTGLPVAAVGTGAGWVIQKLSLTDADAGQRKQAKQFVKSIIDFAAQLNAFAIIGSMQGRAGISGGGGEVTHTDALGYLREALNELGDYASQNDLPLAYEPLNRYETNLINTISDGVALLESLSTKNVTLLADLFHMKHRRNKCGRCDSSWWKTDWPYPLCGFEPSGGRQGSHRFRPYHCRHPGNRL